MSNKRTTSKKPAAKNSAKSPAKSKRTPAERRTLIGRAIAGLLFLFVIGCCVFAVASTMSVVAYRFVNPPATPLMAMRAIADKTLRAERHWTPLSRISPHLIRAVLTSEDARFCNHRGFDWIELEKAIEDYRAKGKLRGASTITNQTAKNVFLLSGRSYGRKLFEAYYTVLMEALWTKDRIFEVYLNIAEWGDGVYGIEAAARSYFDKPAAQLNPTEGALLAAILPNPRVRSPLDPSGPVRAKAAMLERTMSQMKLGENRLCPPKTP